VKDDDFMNACGFYFAVSLNETLQMQVADRTACKPEKLKVNELCARDRECLPAYLVCSEAKYLEIGQNSRKGNSRVARESFPGMADESYDALLTSWSGFPAYDRQRTLFSVSCGLPFV
jgi:hypothetical protein